METRDMPEIVETFRTKFMEGAAGTANRVASACAGLVATPSDMAPHDMGLELARLVGGVLDGLSAAAVTAAALDDSILASTCQHLLRTYARPAQSSSSLVTPRSKGYLQAHTVSDGMRRLMLSDTADAVIGAISERIGGRRLGRESRKVCETELRYFERNRDGLTHALSRVQGLSIGSGSIGSLVRRVVSLGLKGSGMFWKSENAEAFTHMRCMLKSDNWNTLCEEIWDRGEVCA